MVDLKIRSTQVVDLILRLCLFQLTNNNSLIEINKVFGRYDQAAIEGFSKDLNAIAEKWHLQTKATSFSVIENKKARIKRLKPKYVSDIRRSQCQAEKQLQKK